MKRALFLWLFLPISLSCAFGQNTPLDDCARTARMRIYSDAFVSEETGDLGGYELALDRRNDSAVHGLLYVYQGGPSDGIPLTGRVTGNRVRLEGDWVLHVTEYPSGKQITEKRFVRVVGTAGSAAFQGTVSFESLTPERLRLKRVKSIWLCASQTEQGR
ncbi:MAG: hypothetical protein LAN37_14655 [Acidobacteriia bacterium]|nr:hypothetical protein [Terriglobia bacterium]